jgi:hypothetical protein
LLLFVHDVLEDFFFVCGPHKSRPAFERRSKTQFKLTAVVAAQQVARLRGRVGGSPNARHCPRRDLMENAG